MQVVQVDDVGVYLGKFCQQSARGAFRMEACTIVQARKRHIGINADLGAEIVLVIILGSTPPAPQSPAVIPEGDTLRLQQRRRQQLRQAWRHSRRRAGMAAEGR